MAAPDLNTALAALTTQPTIDTETLAVIYDLPPATVYRAIRRGEIPSIHVGRRVRIPTAPIRAQLAGQETPADAT